MALVLLSSKLSILILFPSFKPPVTVITSPSRKPSSTKSLVPVRVPEVTVYVSDTVVLKAAAESCKDILVVLASMVSVIEPTERILLAM